MSSMTRFAFPRLGKLPVSEVTSADVVEALRSVWHVRPATARRVRQRISTVMEWAVAMDYRNDNPCDRIGPVLGPQQVVVEHMRALPHRDVAATVETVRGGGCGSRGQAGVRVSGTHGGAVRRGARSAVGRDGHGGPRVVRPGHADQGEARAPGPAVPARRTDPRRGADAQQGAQRGVSGPELTPEVRSRGVTGSRGASCTPSHIRSHSCDSCKLLNLRPQPRPHDHIRSRYRGRSP